MPSQEPDDKTGPATRTPRSVINEAIRETAGLDKICWWGVVCFGLAGLLTIVVGAVQGSWISAVGVVPTALCWPAVHYAISIRRANISLRMLELVLNNVQTADQALAAISKAFSFHFAQEVKAGVAIQAKK